MKLRILPILFLLINSALIQAQNLVVKDTICNISDIQLPVFKDEIYSKWNFNKKTIKLINTVSSNISTNIYDMKIVKSSDQWYGFYTSRDLKKLYRYSFGSSIENNPIVDDLGDLNGLLTSPHGIDIILSNNTYYGIISNWSSLQPTLLKFDNGLGQLPSIIPNKNIPNITNCSAVDLTLRGDSILAFFNSFSTKKITAVTFSNDLSNASLNKIEFQNNAITPVSQDILVENNRIILLNGQLNGTIGITDLEKSKLTKSANLQINQAFGNAWGAKILTNENSILSFLNCSNNGFIYFNEVDLTINKAINFQALDVKQNGNFTSPIGLDYIRGSEGKTDYLFIHNNKDRKTYIYEIQENTSEWKQIEYTAFNNISNTFISRKDSIFIYPESKNQSISYSSSCTTDSIVFSNKLTNDYIKSYNWISPFFDTIVSSKNFTYFFKEEDSFKTTLKTLDICNRLDSTSTTIKLISPQDLSPSINYTDTVCTLDKITFQNTTTAINDSIIHYEWTLKNKSSNTLAKSFDEPFNYTFIETDTFFLRLNNKGLSGCSIDTTITLIPLKGPNASFEFSNNCLFDSTKVYENSSDQNIQNMQWYVDTFKLGTSPSFNFSNDSIFSRKITLKTYNKIGCENSLEKIINIAPLPINNFDSTYLCNTQNKQILNRSSISDFTPLSHQWFIKDSLLSTEVNPIINIKNVSEINLTLITTSISQCKDTVSKKLKIISSPVINFAANNACLGKEINLLDKSTDAQYPITQRKWLVNQAILNGTNPKYIFASSGDYPIHLEVTNSLGCSSSLEKQISIFNLPKSVFTNSKVCDGKNITFYNNSIADAKDPIKTARWFYDAKALLGDTVNFTYLSSASNLVQLNIETQNGCLSSSSTRIVSSASPVSDFELSTDFGSPTLTVQTINKSKNATSYQWVDKINGNLSTSNSPILSYNEYGTFELSLIATSSSGCTDTSKKFITVSDPNSSYSISNFKHILKDNNAEFSIEVKNSGNRTLDSLLVEIDFGSQFTQKFWLKNMSIPANSKSTITLPISILEENFETYDYICLKSIDTKEQNSNLCILKGEKLNSVSLYPNPAKDLINVSYYNPKVQEIELELFNIHGESLLNQNIQQSIAGKQSISINLGDYTKGIYILILKSEDETLVYKIDKNQ